MGKPSAVLLEHRGVLRVGGPDSRSFLQGVVTADVERVDPGRAAWSAFLTPQGKFLHEFFLVEADGALLLDCEAGRRADLMKRLSIYKLRSKAEIEDATDSLAIVALVGEGALAAAGLPAESGSAAAFAGGVAFVDPRLAALGGRALLPRDGAAAALEGAGFRLGTLADYDRVRLALGVPDGSRDLEVERSILLENGFDELGGVDWKKGCYMGQELTARTKYRGLVKKRLMPVRIDGPAPEPGTPVLREGKEAGVMRSACDGVGLALLRLDRLEGTGAGGLAAGEARLTAQRPDWAAF